MRESELIQRRFDPSEIKQLNDFSDIVLEMVKDERIPESIRLEYMSKIIEKLAKPKYIMNFRGGL